MRLAGKILGWGLAIYGGLGLYSSLATGKPWTYQAFALVLFAAGFLLIRLSSRQSAEPASSENRVGPPPVP